MSEISPAHSSVQALQCRDDILQAMYWLRGEGFRSEADAATLHRFLAVDHELLVRQLRALTADGLVEEHRGGYRLTAAGLHEGGRRFADEFSDLTRSAHGDCPPNCPHCLGVPRDACAHCLGGEEGEGAWAT